MAAFGLFVVSIYFVLTGTGYKRRHPLPCTRYQASTMETFYYLRVGARFVFCVVGFRLSDKNGMEGYAPFATRVHSGEKISVNFEGQSRIGEIQEEVPRTEILLLPKVMRKHPLFNNLK